MEKQTSRESGKRSAGNTADRLEELNAPLRRRRSGQRIRRTIENQIEVRARRRRSREITAASALRGLTKSRA